MIWKILKHTHTVSSFSCRFSITDRINNNANNSLFDNSISKFPKNLENLQSFLKKTLVDISGPNSGDAEGQNQDTAESVAVNFH